MIEKIYRNLCRVSAGFIAGISPNLISGPLRRPVFVIGSPRSGTSIIDTMLILHPGIADLSEANEIWDKYLEFPRPNWVDPYEDASQWESGKTEKMRRQIKTTFELYRRLRFRKIFLNKCPKNTFRLSTLNKMFPDAKYIHIVRDGRAVVNSLSHPDKREAYRLKGYDLPWENYLQELAKFWLENLKEVEKQRLLLGYNSDNFYELKYEDYCMEPKKYMQEIFQFIGIPDDKYDYTSLDKIKSRNYKFSENIESDTIEKISAIMEPQLKKFGYEND